MRTRVRWDRAIVLGTLTLGLLGLAGRALGGIGDAPTVPTRAYVVRSGDTFWSIAQDSVGPTGDPRPVVDLLRELNPVAPGSLSPGLRIALPLETP